MAESQHMINAFTPKLKGALDQVRTVLSVEKLPKQAHEVHHQYRDKYSLTEVATNMSIASMVNCLCSLGLRADDVARLREWAKSNAVSLKFRAEEHCAFDRTVTREIESNTSFTSKFSLMGVASGVRHSVVTTVTEHFYNFTTHYELWAVRGTGQEEADRLLILQRSGRQQLMSTAKDPPRPEAKVPSCELSVNVTWLFRQLQPDGPGPAFVIDRSHPKCKTPRNNPEIIAAQKSHSDLALFCQGVNDYLFYTMLHIPYLAKPQQLDTSVRTVDSIFAPILPLMDGSRDDEGPEGKGQATTRPAVSPAVQAATVSLLPDAMVPEGSAMLSNDDFNSFLQLEMASLADKRASLAQAWPSDDTSATVAEAVLMVTLEHISRNVCGSWRQLVLYVEDMLRTQLIAAIGKEVMPADFAEFMRFHCAKLFRPAFAPLPFSYAVRRSSEHTPEGTVSIEQEMYGGSLDANIPLPIETMVCKSSGSHPMTFKLGASSEVTFDGDKYLHAWVDHRFSGNSGTGLSLVARARQFSSLLVMVGRISSATRFDPTYAAIVQNKDELSMPLELSTIPTPKEFKDAIHSLSPEMQNFAKAFRSMQLEGTLFAVLLVQIKPQLEKVLNLPFDSLTKEIKLTQELMDLFITYQISSDLLSYEEYGRGEAGQPESSVKVAAVKARVAAMKEMIEETKKEEIREAVLEDRMMHPNSFGRAYSDDAFSDMEVGAACSDMVPEAFACFEAEMMCASAEMLDVPMCAAPMPPSAPMAMAVPPPAPPAAAAAVHSAPSPTAPMAMAVPPPAPPAAAAALHSAPSPPSAPPQPQQQQPSVQQPQREEAAGGAGSGGAADVKMRDYTKVPKQLDQQFELLDTDSALRPTKIKLAEIWTKRAQKALLAAPTTTTLGEEEQKKEKDTAFDLLDALTNSGAIPLEDASLHILVAATHCFDKTVTETVVQDNMNPIEKVERSMLIMASTVHQQATAALICEGQHPRVSAASPALFLGNGEGAEPAEL